jgi:hypothetical protein
MESDEKIIKKKAHDTIDSVLVADKYHVDNRYIPFGKHKGKPVEVLAQDRQYCDWLMAQKLKHCIINNAVRNYFSQGHCRGVPRRGGSKRRRIAAVEARGRFPLFCKYFV